MANQGAGDNGDDTEQSPVDDTEQSPVDDTEQRPAEEPGDHLADIPDGAGCTEIWEHLSTERDDDER